MSTDDLGHAQGRHDVHQLPARGNIGRKSTSATLQSLGITNLPEEEYQVTTDPVQLLIEAGAITTDPFAPNSRTTAPRRAFTCAPGRPGALLLRRFIPQRRDIAVAFEHIVHGVSVLICFRPRRWAMRNCTGAWRMRMQ
jgi:hypothetical protein